MRIALVHNEYGRFSGEEAAVNGLQRLLRQRGHEVVRFGRSSADIPRMAFGLWRAFFSGIYNPFVRRLFRRFLVEHRPEVAHVHNLYPLISPSILLECVAQRVPVVMTLHNYRLVCPNGLLFRNGRVCHECLGGRVYRCAWHNCERNWLKSLGYTLRTTLARRSGVFTKHVGQFICLSDFQRRIHVGEGFPPDRMSVIPNPPSEIRIANCEFRNSHSPTRPAHLAIHNPQSALRTPDYVAYVGRLSPEKGISHLMEAARLLPEVPFRLAGSLDRMPDVAKAAPANVSFLGPMPPDDVHDVYRNCRLVVLPSIWYEGLPNVLVEAMAHAKPVVCSRIGGLPEVVEDGVTGLLAEPGNPADLASKIGKLWQNPELCRRLGAAGRAKLLREYDPPTIYEKLMGVYHRAAGRLEPEPAAEVFAGDR